MKMLVNVATGVVFEIEDDDEVRKQINCYNNRTIKIFFRTLALSGPMQIYSNGDEKHRSVCLAASDGEEK